MTLNEFCAKVRQHLRSRGFEYSEIAAMEITSIDWDCTDKELNVSIATFKDRNGDFLDIADILSFTRGL
jgi:hypothetical protein